MSKDFRGTSRQEQSCELKRIKSHTEKECLESRLKHGEWATIYDATVQRVQTVGAMQRKARSAKCVLVVGFCSIRCDEERRWRVDILGLMWWLRYDGVPVLRTLYVSTAYYTNMDWCRGEHWKIIAYSISCATLPECQRPEGNIIKGIIFQCWSRLTVNICFVLS